MTAPPGADHLGAAPGQLASRPRVDLVVGPTPLQPAPLLSRELGVPVLFKRDYLTGPGLGIAVDQAALERVTVRKEVLLG